MIKKLWLNKIIALIDNSKNEYRLILVLSFIVGIVSGLAAVLLKNVVHTLDHFVIHNFSVHYLYLVLPLIGIFLTVLFVRYYVKDNIGHGVSRILYCISKNSSRLKPHNNYSSIVASSLTIGFGGSVGAEAPIVLTGASIGSTLGRLFRQNSKNMMLLVGCGAAGAIGGIFKAPIAGLVFALEILMLDLNMKRVVPLLISSVTGALMAYFFLGNGVAFDVTLTSSFQLNQIHFYAILGIFAGFVSLYFTKMTMYVETIFGNINNWIIKLLIGGASLAAIFFFFPSLYGEGIGTMQSLLDGSTAGIPNNWLWEGAQYNNITVLVFLGVLLLLKVIAMAITTGSGGVGGIFGPTLFIGAAAGFFIAQILNLIPGVDLPAGSFALVGMAGMMAGVMHAPLTAIFLIAEITGGYQLLMPLMLTSTIAYLTIMYFEPHSIYTKRLAARGELITHHKDKAILTLLKLREVIEKDFLTIDQECSLRQLLPYIAKSKRSLFPVVTKENKLVGIVLLNDVRELMFDEARYDDTFVTDIMIKAPDTIKLDDRMENVMRKFNETEAWNLPVVDENRGYVGFVSKSKIFSAYRELLIHFSDE